MKNIKVKFDVTWNELSNSDVENLWCIFDEVNKKIFLDNIPVYKNNISYLDEISVKIKWDEIWFDTVVKKSGNKTMKLYFFRWIDEKIIKSILKELTKLWLSYEWHWWYLFWVNIPEKNSLETVYIFLNKYADKLSYEISNG